MPDAALEATERQWFRLIGESNRVAQIHIHPFTLPIFERGEKAKEHIEKYYDDFESLKEIGLDALIVTGANEETNPHVSDIKTWKPLKDVLEWAYENVTSTISCCLASHALMTYYYKEEPYWRETKRLGVFSHRVLNRRHPLVRGMNTKLDVPHSRFSEISEEQFTRAGMEVLIRSKEAGVHMAVSQDGFRQICFQGHPEYDIFSLLKEYKRDIGWYQEGRLKSYPEMPRHYFGPRSKLLLDEMKEKVLKGEKVDFPEDEITPLLENSWADSARSLISSWIGFVYQITNIDRQKQFMDDVDPQNPLGITPNKNAVEAVKVNQA